MKLPNPPSSYDSRFEGRRNFMLEQADATNRKTTGDVDVGGNAGTKLYLYSANGSRWSIVVDNAGVLSAVAA